MHLSHAPHRFLATLLGLWVLAGGCGHRVTIPVEQAPVIPLQTQPIAVLAEGVECTTASNALSAHLDDIQGLHVDPQADARLVVEACGLRLDEGARSDGTRALHGHALVRVQVGERELGRLVAAAHTPMGSPVLSMRSWSERNLMHQLAQDVAEQLGMGPQTVTRRAHPRAGEGSRRYWQNQAVLAELQGELHQARAHVVRSQERHASPKSRLYLAALERRILIQSAGMPSEEDLDK